MLNLLKKITQLLRAKQENRLGDFAILKADLAGAKVDRKVAPLLESVVGYYPAIDLDTLIQLPVGTFGYEYAKHMRENQLIPFNVSPELDDVAQRNVFALRYAVTHDIFHVLLGFDTSYAGEIGVLAFAAEQGYSSMLQFSLQIAKWWYPVIAPNQRDAIRRNTHNGQALAQKAQFLLGYRFEEHWREPIEQVRSHLGLPPQPGLFPQLELNPIRQNFSRSVFPMTTKN
ncbi:MAG TPA: Coq4 family protein [Leptolyngbyaceae cyanobacterium]